MENKLFENINKFKQRAEEYFSPEYAEEHRPYNVAGLSLFLGCNCIKDLMTKKNLSDEWRDAISRLELRIEDYMTRKALMKELDGNMVSRYNSAYNSSYQADKAPMGPRVIVLNKRDGSRVRGEILDAKDVNKNLLNE